MATQQGLKQWTLAFDWVLLALTLAIASIGVVNLFSAASVLPQPLHYTQAFWIGLGGLFAAALTIIGRDVPVEPTGPAELNSARVRRPSLFRSSRSKLARDHCHSFRASARSLLRSRLAN